MRRRIFIFIIMAVFLFSQAAVVDARSFGGRSFHRSSFSSSKSWGSRSFSRSSKSWSGSTKSSSGRSWFGSKNSTGSSRSVPGSYSTSRSKTKSTSGAAMRKNTYMQDAYKKQASTASYSKYKQKLNAEQQKAYNSAMNSNYSAKTRMNFEDSIRTKTSRINNFGTRRIYINVNPVYFGSPFSYGYAHVGMWDLWFLMRASDLFWYNHWNEIYPYRDYFQDREFAQMEARVKKLEQQYNGVRDTSYMEDGVDPDIQISDEYQQSHPESVYYTNRYSSPSGNAAAAVIVIAVVAIILILILRSASRAKPKKTYNSRIY